MVSRVRPTLNTVPQPLADSLCAPFGLVQVPHPVELPEVAINLFWHARVHRDPANAWLRGLVTGLFAAG